MIEFEPLRCRHPSLPGSAIKLASFAAGTMRHGKSVIGWFRRDKPTTLRSCCSWRRASCPIAISRPQRCKSSAYGRTPPNRRRVLWNFFVAVYRDLPPGAGDAGNAKSFMSFWRATIASQRTSDIAITGSDWLIRLAPTARPPRKRGPSGIPPRPHQTGIPAYARTRGIFSSRQATALAKTMSAGRPIFWLSPAWPVAAALPARRQLAAIPARSAPPNRWRPD